MKKISSYFKDYDAFHRTKGNKACHVFGIPVIVMTLLGLLDRVEFAPWAVPVIHLSAATLLYVVGVVFYLVLHVQLGLTLAVSTLVLWFAGASLPTSVNWGLFALGWLVQFFGHAMYERKQPAFLRNVVHLMIGPAYIQNYLLKIVR